MYPTKDIDVCQLLDFSWESVQAMCQVNCRALSYQDPGSSQVRSGVLSGCNLARISSKTILRVVLTINQATQENRKDSIKETAQGNNGIWKFLFI